VVSQQAGGSPTQAKAGETSKEETKVKKRKTKKVIAAEHTDSGWQVTERPYEEERVKLPGRKLTLKQQISELQAEVKMLSDISDRTHKEKVEAQLEARRLRDEREFHVRIINTLCQVRE
jgi:hypothetical protein